MPTSIWSSFRNSIEGKSSSRQLAMGVTLGMMVGLIPKDSLLVVAFSMVAILSPANLLTASTAGVLFSLVACWVPFQRLSHVLGEFFLNINIMQPTYQWIAAQPLLPWMQLDNTIVVGTLLIGLAICAPVYLATCKAFDRFGDAIYARMCGLAVFRWLMGPQRASLNEGRT